jgi:DtxR family Mn-dependent transcriptional regulator
VSDPTYTASVEDYLKAIYELSRGRGHATTSDVATRLGVARPSVSGMAARLAGQRLVTHERYRGLTLTQAGRGVALQLIRRHRVIEAYLVTALGYGWDQVDGEAERLEHAASDDLVDRMARAIGEPEADPHGAPIPSRRGIVVEQPRRSLGQLAPGDRARVVRVEDNDPQFLRHLSSLGLIPGATVRLLRQAPFDGPLAVRVGSKTRHVGPSLAARVFVASSGAIPRHSAAPPKSGRTGAIRGR